MYKWVLLGVAVIGGFISPSIARSFLPELNFLELLFIAAFLGALVGVLGYIIFGRGSAD